MFEDDKNAGVEKNDGTIVNFDNSSNNIWKTTYLAVFSLGCI